MPKSRVEAGLPWWRRRTPSFFTLVAVLVVLTGGTLLLSSMAGDAIPKVPTDKAGTDSWDEPLAIIQYEVGLRGVLIPECAAGLVTRVVLWDENSEPYWEISGPATPLTEFALGFAPDGFITEVEYVDPDPDAVVRLVVFRRVGGPMGLRFRLDDLVEGRVMGGSPLTSYSKDGWMKAKVCSGGGVDGAIDPDTA